MHWYGAIVSQSGLAFSHCCAERVEIFELDDRQGGVRRSLSSGALYCEIPGHSIPGILDGFMSSLLGLYDLFVETGDSAVENLFIDGIAGLKRMIPTWDYRKRWSWVP